MYPAAAGAQSLTWVTSGIPAWADSLLAQAGTAATHELTGLSPEVGWGDFDGDGFLDVALGVVERGSARRRGIAIVHRVSGAVHIVAAGRPVADGLDDLPVFAGWGVERLPTHRDVLRVDGASPWNGWITWNGSSYTWVAGSE